MVKAAYPPYRDAVYKGPYRALSSPPPPRFFRSLNFLSIYSVCFFSIYMCLFYCLPHPPPQTHTHAHSFLVVLAWGYQAVCTCYLLSSNAAITALYFLLWHPGRQTYDKDTQANTHAQKKKPVTLMSISSQSSDSLHWAFSYGSCSLCLHVWLWMLFVLSFFCLFVLNLWREDSFLDAQSEDMIIPAVFSNIPADCKLFTAPNKCECSCVCVPALRSW